MLDWARFWKDKAEKKELALAEAKKQLGSIEKVVRQTIDFLGEDQWSHLIYAKFERWDSSALSASQNVQLIADELRKCNQESTRVKRENSQLNQDLKKAKNDHLDYIQVLQGTHASEQEALQKEHKAETHRLNMYYWKMEQDFKSKIDGMVTESAGREERFKTEMQRLRKSHEDGISKLRRAHTQQLDYLKKDIQSRNKALIERETAQGVEYISDRELKAKLSELNREVDALARTPWAFNHSDWTEEAMNQMSISPKRLRKLILQDTMWSTFYEHIFCSPFRVLGEEGRRLEEQWSAAFPPGKRPNAGLNLMAIREAYKALEVATSEYDPRTKLRQGYKESLDGIRKVLAQHLAKVCMVDDSMLHSIEKVSKKAARTWLEFGMQRCRLVINMQDIANAGESDGVGGESFVEFVLKPQLKRIGDSEGELFDKVEVVAGCEGEVNRISYGEMVMG